MSPFCRYTSKYVSPLLCVQELAAIQQKPTEHSNMSVSVIEQRKVYVKNFE